MTVEEFRNLHVTFGGGFKDVRVSLHEDTADASLELRLTWNVEDVYSATPRIIPVMLRTTFGWKREFSKWTEEQVRTQIYYAAKQLIEHELLESLKINGKRFKNPHPERKKVRAA